MSFNPKCQETRAFTHGRGCTLAALRALEFGDLRISYLIA